MSMIVTDLKGGNAFPAKGRITLTQQARKHPLWPLYFSQLTGRMIRGVEYDAYPVCSAPSAACDKRLRSRFRRDRVSIFSQHY